MTEHSTQETMIWNTFGATRNLMGLKLAQEQDKREEVAEKKEETTNPMKLLENRTQQSKQEIELMDSLEELGDLNRRLGNVDYDTILLKYNPAELIEQIKWMREEEDDRIVREFDGIKRSIYDIEDAEDLPSKDDNVARCHYIY